MIFFLDAVEQGTDTCEKRFLVELLCSAPYNREVRQVALIARFTCYLPLMHCLQHSSMDDVAVIEEERSGNNCTELK